MVGFRTEYIAAGGNRHPAAADWNPTTGLLAYGSDINVALWKPLVRFEGPTTAAFVLMDEGRRS